MSNYYSESELAELQASIRAEVQSELEASQRSQSGLAQFLRALGFHALARTVLSLTASAWQQFKKLIGWY